MPGFARVASVSGGPGETLTSDDEQKRHSRVAALPLLDRSDIRTLSTPERASLPLFLRAEGRSSGNRRAPNSCLLMPLRRHYSNPAVRQAIEQLWSELPANRQKRSDRRGHSRSSDEPHGHKSDGSGVRRRRKTDRATEGTTN